MRLLTLPLLCAGLACQSTPVAVDGAPATDRAPGPEQRAPDLRLPDRAPLHDTTAWSCRALAPQGAPVGAAVTVSDPTLAAFLPSVAARGELAVIAWHEFPAGGTARVSLSAARQGCLGPTQPIPDALPGQKRPVLAATASGFALAYEAESQGLTVVRLLLLDAEGQPRGAPKTLSAAGALGAMPQIAAAADEVVVAWTDGKAHYLARESPVSPEPATLIDTTLASTGLLNFPRVALDSKGNLFVAYRDGPTTQDWEVWLRRRAAGQTSFGAAQNISRSPGLLSDDIALAVEPGGRLLIIWVDQDGAKVDAFEVTYAMLDPSGALSLPWRYANQGLWAWSPSVVNGLRAVWRTGEGSAGELFFAAPAQAPAHLLGPDQASAPRLAVDDADRLHLVYVASASSAKVVRYARGK